MADPMHQAAANARAVRNLAGRLESLGYKGSDVHQVAENLIVNLLADGYKPLERPVPKQGSGSSAQARADALAATQAAVDEARRKRTQHA